jgi:glycine cleavage system H protein
MEVKTGLYYAASHEWVEFLDDTTALVGISDHAQHELGDLVFVNLPKVGDQTAVGKTFADVESVKAVSDIYAPVAGTVAEVNDQLLDEPERMNQAPYGAWIAKIGNISQRGDLMDAAAYQDYCKTL